MATYRNKNDDTIFYGGVKIGNTEITDVSLGSTPINQIYVGNDLIWERTAPVLPYDAEVEYLHSSGTAYIDTGIECTSKLKVEFEGLVTTDVNAAICGGISNASGSTYFRHHWSPNKTNFYWIQRSSSSSASVTRSYSTDTWYNVTIDPINGTASINGTSKTFTKITNLYTTSQNYYIFARKAQSGSIQSRPGKFKFFKIWNDGTLVRDFIPVRVDTTGYMYDRVSGTLFGTVGSGDFTYGNDVTQ